MNISAYQVASSHDLHEKVSGAEEGNIFIDDLSGKKLDSAKVRVARNLEMRTFEEMKVYEYMRREEARSRGKVIGVRWVDTMKDGVAKSRLVAQEFASNSDRDDIFAGTPPLMVSKFVISETASRGRHGRTNRRIMVLDVKRAFLYGDIEEEIYIELPEEDPMKKEGFVGRLKKGDVRNEVGPIGVAEDGAAGNGEVGFQRLYHHTVSILSSRA